MNRSLPLIILFAVSFFSMTFLGLARQLFPLLADVKHGYPFEKSTVLFAYSAKRAPRVASKPFRTRNISDKRNIVSGKGSRVYQSDYAAARTHPPIKHN
ncbi:hypothetical protein KP509_16G055200 [Ceratopteris richardii]|uniref:Uncharacterized protein n=1 Tax=Ceratopteris richardii TaxID=49495 RepID=A0A8T2T284_CERRI|nr:hypothetical protein KP509_16G055200 [Ceratopteris richardii]